MKGVNPVTSYPQSAGVDRPDLTADSLVMRLRITFAKTESMRYTSHLDLHRTWERTIRRAGLPLAYSQGFNPHPRLQLAMALPLGFTSECELLDAWFETGLDLPAAKAALERAVPPGLQVLAVEGVELRAPPLQTQVLSARYFATLLDPVLDLESRLDALMSVEELPRERRGKAYNLRPLIETLSSDEPDGDGNARLYMRLAAREGLTGRPEEVLLALDIPPGSARVHRTQLIFAETADKGPLPAGTQD